MPTYQIVAPKKGGGRLTQAEFQQCISALQHKNTLEKNNGCTLLRLAIYVINTNLRICVS